ncbi:MAG: ankyrin repeat domain-containing protein, partial [Candidatus Jacksonbacteria bacterium]|nr:ankyrin repeat domain-containing protein [Candidatus Jacksonbacteria bacterium]
MNAKRMLLIAGAIAAVIAAFWVIELELDRKTVPEITQGTPRDRLIRGIKENNPSVVLKALEDGAFNGTAVPRVSGSEPALLAAVMHMCDPAIIKHLIEHYAYVNQRDKVLENTALIAAISRWNLALEPDPGITEIVQLLIDAGAYVNWGNKAGETPLLLAVNNGNFPAAMLLLQSEDN